MNTYPKYIHITHISIFDILIDKPFSTDRISKHFNRNISTSREKYNDKNLNYSLDTTSVVKR